MCAPNDLLVFAGILIIVQAVIIAWQAHPPKVPPGYQPRPTEQQPHDPPGAK